MRKGLFSILSLLLSQLFIPQPCLNIRFRRKRSADRRNSAMPRGTSRMLPRVGVTKLVIAIRHGESIGNIYSDSIKSARKSGDYPQVIKQGVRLLANVLHARAWPSLDKESFGEIEDSPLSIEGRADMINVGKALFGDERNEDKFQIFSQGSTVVKFSPLRRAIATTQLVFGVAAEKLGTTGIQFEAEPLAHELKSSLSDEGLRADDLAEFAEAYAVSEKTTPNTFVAKQMHDSIRKRVPLHWYLNQTYYDQTKKEGETYFNERMQRLMMSILDDQRRIVILVAHSKVLQYLFKDFFAAHPTEKPENGGVLAGYFSPASHGNWSWSCVDNTRSEFNTLERRFPWGVDTSEVPFIVEDHKRADSDSGSDSGSSDGFPSDDESP